MVRPSDRMVDRRTVREFSQSDRMVRRADYVPKQDEDALLQPDAAGLPQLRFVFIFDRLVLVSALHTDSLINPKSPNLRKLDLHASYARGSGHHESAFRAADHRPGAWVDLYREPSNPYDSSATQMRSPGAGATFGYVQRGRSPAVARLIDRGADCAGITMREGFVMIGPRAVLEHLLTPFPPRPSFLQRLFGRSTD